MLSIGMFYVRIASIESNSLTIYWQCLLKTPSLAGGESQEVNMNKGVDI